MLACWLALSPFVFGHGDGAARLWVTDLSAAALVAALSLSSYAERFKYAHRGNIAVAIVLIFSAFLFSASPPSGAYQNHVVVGLLVLMLSIIPNRASQIPAAWEQYYRADD